MTMAKKNSSKREPAPSATPVDETLPPDTVDQAGGEPQSATESTAESPYETSVLDEALVASTQALRQVTEHQAKIEAQAAAIAEIERAIEAQENDKLDALSRIGSTAEHEAALEDVRANLALKVISENEAVRIEKDLEAKILTIKNDAGSAQRATVLAQRAIDALNRRLLLAKSELAESKAIMPRLVDELIVAEADVVAVEYLEVAKTLIEHYRTMIALNRMYTSRAGRDRSSSIYGYHPGILIPTFRTPACEAQRRQAQNYDWATLYNAIDEREISEAVARIREDFAALGVNEDYRP